MLTATPHCIWLATTDRTWWSMTLSRQGQMSTRWALSSLCETVTFCTCGVTVYNLWCVLVQVNERGFSALHFASSSRQGALCQELLLAHGAHINMQVCPYTLWYRNPHVLYTEEQIPHLIIRMHLCPPLLKSVSCLVSSIKLTVLLTLW